VTNSTKSNSPGKFSSPPNKNGDASEKEIQDYFMSEFKVLEGFRRFWAYKKQDQDYC
jgi:hypothetical protein